MVRNSTFLNLCGLNFNYCYVFIVCILYNKLNLCVCEYRYLYCMLIWYLRTQIADGNGFIVERQQICFDLLTIYLICQNYK